MCSAKKETESMSSANEPIPITEDGMKAKVCRKKKEMPQIVSAQNKV